MARPATGSITEMPTGWRFRFRANGRRESITFARADAWTRAKVEEEAANVLADVRRGLWKPKRTPPTARSTDGDMAMPAFEAFARSWYLGRWRSLARATCEDYEWRLNRHLGPAFEQTPINEITVAAVDAYRDGKLAAYEANQAERAAYDAAVKAGRAPAGSRPKPVAGPASINKTLVLLGAILDVAVERDLIEQNPMRVNPRNRFARIPRAARPRRTYLDSAAHISALLDAADELDAHPRAAHPGVRRAALALLLFGGLRIGEALALRWRDVNLADGRIALRGTKTAAAVRIVPMLPVLRDELSAWKTTTRHDTPGDYVVATGTGTRWSAANVRNRILKPATGRANEIIDSPDDPLPHLTPHSLRRTAASIWATLDWPMTDTMAAMGHTSASLTLTTYASVMRLGDRERQALRALAEGAEWDRLDQDQPGCPPDGQAAEAA